MSRAFTKEDDSGGPVLIPDRAPLPDGAVNYVTKRGLELLQEELRELEQERSRLTTGDPQNPDRIRGLTVVNGTIAKLKERLDSARLMLASDQPEGEVRFGATVNVEAKSRQRGSRTLSFTIVGVDEAGTEPDKVAFTAPIARAIMGTSPGDEVQMPTGLVWDSVRVLDIAYRDDGSGGTDHPSVRSR